MFRDEGVRWVFVHWWLLGRDLRRFFHSLGCLRMIISNEYRMLMRFIVVSWVFLCFLFRRQNSWVFLPDEFHHEFLSQSDLVYLSSAVDVTCGVVLLTCRVCTFFSWPMLQCLMCTILVRFLYDLSFGILRCFRLPSQFFRPVESFALLFFFFVLVLVIYLWVLDFVRWPTACQSRPSVIWSFSVVPRKYILLILCRSFVSKKALIQCYDFPLS